jgi:hypothetical protein
MALAGSSQALVCPNCTTTAPVGARFCPECGSDLGKSNLSSSTLQYPIAQDGNAPPAPAAPAARSGPLVPLVVLVVGLLLMIVFGVLGLWWTEVVIVPVTLVMAFMCVESWWDRYSEDLETKARRGLDRVWAFGRVGRVALVSWTRAAARHVSIWVRRLPVRRRHNQALHALGKAVYSGDDHLARVYRSMAVSTGERLEEFRRELQKAQHEAETEVEHERLSTDSTQVFSTKEGEDSTTTFVDRP